jgi:hypothetical protein
MQSGVLSRDHRLTTSDFRLRGVSGVRIALALVVSLILPLSIFWIRGICWESLVASIVVFAIGTIVLRAPIALWLATLAFVVTIGTVGLLGWSVLNFHTVNVFSSSYSRISFCGRDFEAEGPSTSQVIGGARRRVVGVTPSGSAILSSGACLSTLWVRSPGPTFQSFDLEGGP